MFRRIAFAAATMTILPLFAAAAQRLEPSAFARTTALQATPELVALQAAPAQCRKSVLRFAGQFLAGTATAVAGAMAFSEIKPQKSFDDYGFHGDSYGSSNYLRAVLVATTLGAGAGVWIAAPRACRAIVPALIGAGIPALLMASAVDGEADAIATAITFVFALPAQALVATISQTIAR